MVLAATWNALPAAQRARIKTAAAMPQDQIDTDDVPEIPDWSGAERGKFYRPLKRQLTLRVDADVVDWFRTAGTEKGGYQTMMNRVLRAAMLRGRRRRA